MTRAGIGTGGGERQEPIVVNVKHYFSSMAVFCILVVVAGLGLGAIYKNVGNAFFCMRARRAWEFRSAVCTCR